MWEKLAQLDKRYHELGELMTQPGVLSDARKLQSLGQERAGLEDVVDKYHQYQVVKKELEETHQMLSEGQDREMAALVKEELDQLIVKQEQLMQELKRLLIPKDPHDTRDIIMEIRAGVGGEEAALFAADLFRMYSRYAQNRRWGVDILSASEGSAGGFKEVVFEITGKGVYSRLKYERGVHRVQRVPTTEASGRVHTSTVTVAVLPKAEEVDVEINPSDVEIDIFHSGSAGGQNVNKVSTAVRLTHLPTGMVVVCQDERSQLQNKMKAFEVLRTRLLDMERRKQEEQIIKDRRSQVGTADRAEKIRTYNFPQDRITDHRINLTLHNLPRILAGGLDELIDALATSAQVEQLEAQLV